MGSLLFPHKFSSSSSSSSPTLSSAVKLTRLPILSSIRVTCSANANNSVSTSKEDSCKFKELRNVACGILAVWALTTTTPVIAANQVQCLLVTSAFSVYDLRDK